MEALEATGNLVVKSIYEAKLASHLKAVSGEDKDIFFDKKYKKLKYFSRKAFRVHLKARTGSDFATSSVGLSELSGFTQEFTRGVRKSLSNPFELLTMATLASSKGREEPKESKVGGTERSLSKTMKRVASGGTISKIMRVSSSATMDEFEQPQQRSGGNMKKSMSSPFSLGMMKPGHPDSAEQSKGNATWESKAKNETRRISSSIKKSLSSPFSVVTMNPNLDGPKRNATWDNTSKTLPKPKSKTVTELGLEVDEDGCGADKNYYDWKQMASEKEDIGCKADSSNNYYDWKQMTSEKEGTTKGSGHRRKSSKNGTLKRRVRKSHSDPFVHTKRTSGLASGENQKNATWETRKEDRRSHRRERSTDGTKDRRSASPKRLSDPHLSRKSTFEDALARKELVSKVNAVQATSKEMTQMKVRLISDTQSLVHTVSSGSLLKSLSSRSIMASSEKEFEEPEEANEPPLVNTLSDVNILEQMKIRSSVVARKLSMGAEEKNESEESRDNDSKRSRVVTGQASAKKEIDQLAAALKHSKETKLRTSRSCELNTEDQTAKRALGRKYRRRVTSDSEKNDKEDKVEKGQGSRRAASPRRQLAASLFYAGDSKEAKAISRQASPKRKSAPSSLMLQASSFPSHQSPPLSHTEAKEEEGSTSRATSPRRSSPPSSLLQCQGSKYSLLLNGILADEVSSICGDYKLETSQKAAVEIS